VPGLAGRALRPDGRGSCVGQGAERVTAAGRLQQPRRSSFPIG
jgi:hypothetical protein